MIRNFSLLFLLLTVAATVAAESLDFNVNNDAAELRYIMYSRNSSGMGDTELDLGILYTTDDDIMASIGLAVVDEAGTRTPGLDVGVGFRFVATSSDNIDFLALPLGGRFRFSPPSMSRFAVSGRAFYSPDIVTFVDAESFSYVTVRAEYELLPQAVVYVGYRDIKADLDPGPRVRVEHGGHVGVEVVF